MSRLNRFAELAVNLILVIVSVALIGGAIHSNVIAHKNVATNNVAPAIGTKIEIPEVSWAESRKTVILVLSTHCPFCIGSADFYRRLHSLVDLRRIPIVAVFPQTSVEASAYLANLGIQVTTVRQVPLNDLNVSATPTLIIVDPEGRVTDSWVGKLPAQTEREVLSRF